MNKFLQAESIEQVVACNKVGKKRLADDPMDCESRAQLNKGNKVDFNLNNISDATEVTNSDSMGDSRGDSRGDSKNSSMDDSKSNSMSNSMSDSMDDPMGDSMNDSAGDSSTSSRRTTAKRPVNQPLVNDHLPERKAVEIEHLKQSSKKKAGRILRRIEKVKNKLNCSEQHALDLITERKRRRETRTASGRLSLEEHLSKENGLRNELKVGVLRVRSLKFE